VPILILVQSFGIFDIYIIILIQIHHIHCFTIISVTSPLFYLSCGKNENSITYTIRLTTIFIPH
jgi:hypothetical protein